MGTEIYNQNHDRHKNIHGKPNASPSANKNFLPILCRLSLKDSIAIAPHTTSIVCPKQNDPCSPKVSCMGQVKRHHRNMFSGNNKYVETRVDERRRRRRHISTTCSSNNAGDNKCAAVVPLLNLAQLDPPLSVIKRLPSDGEQVSLWKRRSREHGQLTNIQIPTFHCAYSIHTSPTNLRLLIF